MAFQDLTSALVRDIVKSVTPSCLVRFAVLGRALKASQSRLLTFRFERRNQLSNPASLTGTLKGLKSHVSLLRLFS